jgi:hypothetical protein
MCGCPVGVRRRVRAVERNRFGVFFDGLLSRCLSKSTNASARNERERESVYYERARAFRILEKSIKRRKKEKNKERKKKEREHTKKKHASARVYFVRSPLRTARSYTERSRLLCTGPRFVPPELPFFFSKIFLFFL